MKKLQLLIALAFSFGINLQAQTITTGTVNNLVAAGSTISVPYTITGSFTAGNVFTAQLSNNAGSFSSPVNIGTLTSAAAGSITATVPAATALGSGYRIRVVSSTPVVTGSSNTTNITIVANATANSWTRKADGQYRYSGFSFVIGNKAYIGGGLYSTSGQFATANIAYRNDLWEYDPNANVWTQKANLLTEFTSGGGSYEGSCFSVGGNGYLLTGKTKNNAGTEVFANMFQQYDPGTNTWTDKTTAINSTELKWSAQSANFTINDIAYVGNGVFNASSNAVSTTISVKWYQYNPSANTFTAIASYPGTTAICPVAFAANNTGYLLSSSQL